MADGIIAKERLLHNDAAIFVKSEYLTEMTFNFKIASKQCNDRFRRLILVELVAVVRQHVIFIHYVDGIYTGQMRLTRARPALDSFTFWPAARDYLFGGTSFAGGHSWITIQEGISGIVQPSIVDMLETDLIKMFCRFYA